MSAFKIRLTYSIVAGLLLAAIVHLAVVLCVPLAARNDAWSRLSKIRPHAADAPILVSQEWAPPFLDPAMAMSACVFDLKDGPVRLAAKGKVSFWSIAFHARGGGVFYALNDKAAIQGQIDLTLLTQRQLNDLQAQEEDDEPTRDIRIVSPANQGFVIFRALSALYSERQQAEDLVASAICETKVKSTRR